MISHITLGITDFERASAFYETQMSLLGHRLRFKDPTKPWAGWMPADTDRPILLITRPFDGGAAQPGNGLMVALLAPTRAVVDACYEAAIAAGAQGEGEPGLRPQYHPDYYGAYFRDPDGNKLCICCHTPDG